MLLGSVCRASGNQTLIADDDDQAPRNPRPAWIYSMMPSSWYVPSLYPHIDTKRRRLIGVTTARASVRHPARPRVANRMAPSLWVPSVRNISVSMFQSLIRRG